MKTIDLVKMAMYLALFAVLDFVAARSGIFVMPQGGSLGLGAIALALASIDLGWRKGLLLALVSIAIQVLTSPPLYFVAWGQFFLDYILAYAMYGTIVLYPIYNRKGFTVVTGVIIANLLRLLFHVISGMVYYGVPLIGSITYNSWYMIPTLLVSFVVVGGLMPRLNLHKVKK
jgi:thiamine transporter